MPVDPTNLVREFHEFFGLPARTAAELRILSGDELEFRRKLLVEEYDELIEALDNGDDLAHIYKEMADLAYVLYGLDQHMGGKLSEVVSEVHASNMTKLWPCDNCNGRGYKTTTNFYDNGGAAPVAEKIKVDCLVCHNTGKIARYREDGKVLKPPTYVKPDLSTVLNDGP